MVSKTPMIGQSPAPAERGALLVSADPVAEKAGEVAAEAQALPKPDRPALDPTRYGDWEKNGRCIDF